MNTHKEIYTAYERVDSTLSSLESTFAELVGMLFDELRRGEVRRVRLIIEELKHTPKLVDTLFRSELDQTRALVDYIDKHPLNPYDWQEYEALVVELECNLLGRHLDLMERVNTLYHLSVRELNKLTHKKVA